MILRFDQDVDRESNFKHSTVLAMPIKHAGSPGRVLGVFQLVNKFDNLPFTRYPNDFGEKKNAQSFRDLFEGLLRTVVNKIDRIGSLYFPPQFV